ncbi:MAG: hypothetical protein ABSC64_02485 [Candidatus Korobacteraceae bacterium]|jgi:hypothetical protein
MKKTNQRGLVIFVEGPDDKRFCERIIQPRCNKYKSVQIRRHASLPTKQIVNEIKFVKSRNYDYAFVVDINDEPCVTSKKQKKEQEIGGLDSSKIIVVIKEIESWYLAGLDDTNCKKFGIPSPNHTNTTTKEMFNDRFKPRLSKKGHFPDTLERRRLLGEILDCFDEETALSKNDSFDYFLRKFCNEDSA